MEWVTTRLAQHAGLSFAITLAILASILDAALCSVEVGRLGRHSVQCARAMAQWRTSRAVESLSCVASGLARYCLHASMRRQGVEPLWCEL